jgi:hypothetical protein
MRERRGSVIDRRSGKDRRRLALTSNVLNGGEERRVGRERRDPCERRSDWVRVGQWFSVLPWEGERAPTGAAV